jgi:ubiquinone/menaquinone biosynthesis C-methylase UbiE
MSGDDIDLKLEAQVQRASELEDRVQRLLAPFTGEERALDSGCGAGALAFALSPHVREVIGVDLAMNLLDAGRERAPANVTLLEADATALPFGYGEFDIAGSARVLHHAERPERVVSELARVTRPGGRILIVDQLGDVDPLRAREIDRFEHARDPSHTRLLPDGDIRALLEANDLVVDRNEVTREQRELEWYLDLAGTSGEAREEAKRLAPGPVYDVAIGWYVARKRA